MQAWWCRSKVAGVAGVAKAGPAGAGHLFTKKDLMNKKNSLFGRCMSRLECS